MGTTAVAVGSSFATTLHTFRCIHSKQLWPSDPLLRIASNRMLQGASISNSHPIEQFPDFSIPFFRKWRIPRIAAAVAQEEAAVDEEEKGEGEGGKGREEVSGGESEEGGLNTKIYFGNLPYHCDSAQLAGIIQQYGNPELVEVLYDRDTGRSRGFGFVTMSNIEDAKLVINNLDGIEYGGRTLRVNFSDRPRPKEPLYPETEYKLFVGNLSWSVTSESLIQVFQEYGNVVGARVLYDGETGRSRGYGFVCYSTKSEMDAAIESLNGVELEGRAMRVSLAEGKKSSA